MFLKVFPRYAGRARRGATVAGDHLRGTAVVVENAPKSLSRHDGASVIRACRQRCEELVAETLVVPFCVIVHSYSVTAVRRCRSLRGTKRSRHDGASVIRACRQRCEELVAETLVVPFCVIVHYVFGYPLSAGVAH